MKRKMLIGGERAKNRTQEKKLGLEMRVRNTGKGMKIKGEEGGGSQARMAETRERCIERERRLKGREGGGGSGGWGGR